MIYKSGMTCVADISRALDAVSGQLHWWWTPYLIMRPSTGVVG